MTGLAGLESGRGEAFWIQEEEQVQEVQKVQKVQKVQEVQQVQAKACGCCTCCTKQTVLARHARIHNWKGIDCVVFIERFNEVCEDRGGLDWIGFCWKSRGL